MLLLLMFFHRGFSSGISEQLSFGFLGLLESGTAISLRIFCVLFSPPNFELLFLCFGIFVGCEL